jgi:hypothetical protein
VPLNFLSFEVQKQLGLERVVVVQRSGYGF